MKGIVCKGGCGNTTTSLSGYCLDCREYAPKMSRKHRRCGVPNSRSSGEPSKKPVRACPYCGKLASGFEAHECYPGTRKGGRNE